MMRLCSIAAAAAVLCALPAYAQNMYVSDELVITLRTGPSTQNTIIANLRSGDAVEVLERDEESGYSRVRVVGSNQDEGWVLTRYLMTEQTSAARLAETARELVAAQQRVQRLEAELADTQTELTNSRAALAAAEDGYRNASTELDEVRTVSAGALELKSRNESLRQRNVELSSEVDALVIEANRLGDRSRQNWFVVGALVLAFGIVIGLVAPSLRARRRSNW
jgi:SH3 domain protein